MFRNERNYGNFNQNRDKRYFLINDLFLEISLIELKIKDEQNLL